MARKEAPQRLSPFSIAWRAIIRAIIMGALCFSLVGFIVLVWWLDSTESRVRFRYVMFAPVTLIASVVVGVFAIRAGVTGVPAVLLMLVLTYALLTCIVAVFESYLPPHRPQRVAARSPAHRDSSKNLLEIMQTIGIIKSLSDDKSKKP